MNVQIDSESVIITRFDSFKVILFKFPGGQDIIFYTVNDARVIDHETALEPVETLCYVCYPGLPTRDLVVIEDKAEELCKVLHAKYFRTAKLTRTSENEKGFPCIRLTDGQEINESVSELLAKLVEQDNDIMVFPPDQVASV